VFLLVLGSVFFAKWNLTNFILPPEIRRFKLFWAFFILTSPLLLFLRRKTILTKIGFQDLLVQLVQRVFITRIKLTERAFEIKPGGLFFFSLLNIEALLFLGLIIRGSILLVLSAIYYQRFPAFSSFAVLQLP
jgi:hypothetical protein